jgi:hypothetical protein
MGKRRLLQNVLFVAAMAATSLTHVAARAEAPGLVPRPDPAMGDGGVSPFYLWGKQVPPTPGKLLRQEAAPAAQTPEHAGKAFRILYTSRSGVGSGEPVAVSGVVFLPKGMPPAGGWPIVAWSHGTRGIADVCAPSWAGSTPRDMPYLDGWLSEGFAIIATDYEGLGTPGAHPYLLYKSEAHSILDSVRALLNDKSVPLKNEVVLVGQSQGAGAGLGAAWAAPSYAPDLNVRAAVLTGLVTSIATAQTHTKAQTYSDPMKMDAGFAMLRFAGTDHSQHPEADLPSFLTPAGKVMLQTALHACLSDVFNKAAVLGLHDGGGEFSRSISPIDHDMEESFTLPSGHISVPVFVGTGLDDKMAGVGGQYDAVGAMCSAGSNVVWHTYPGLTHSTAVMGSFKDSSSFVRAILAGKVPVSNCQMIATLRG